MYSTALKTAILGATLLLATCASFAANKPPRTLKEPVLGLRYEVSKVRFELFPDSERVKCEANENATSVWFIYARHKANTGRTYYISGGYAVWRDPEPGQKKYEADDYGGVFYVEGEKCVYLDEVKQVFIDRIFNDEMDLYILQGLASDYSVRLQGAFGGVERVRQEIHSQRIDTDDLPPELREALKHFIAPALPSR